MSSSEPASSSEPVRQPANDLVAFDISKQSPEQIAQLFARWKEQRKRLNAPEPPRRGGPPHLRPVPPIVGGADAARTQAPPALAEDGSIRYSAPFEALLSVREPSLAARVWNPDARLQTLARPHPPRRRSRTKWALAGAASFIAVAALAGGAVWERGIRAGGTPESASVVGREEAALSATPAYPTDIPLVEPLAATAMAAGAADWPMRRTVDLALMKAAPVEETAPLALIPQLKPPVPAVHTASKPLASPVAASAPSPRPMALPPAASARQEAIARVELPLVPNAAPAPALVSPAAPVAAAPSEYPRPDGVSSRGNNRSNYTFGASERVAASDGTLTGGGASGGAAKPGSGSSGGASSGGDPTGGSGGDGSGSGDPGGGTGGETGGSDTGGSGDGDTGGGDSGGDAGGGDAGGAAGGSGDGGGGGDSGGGGGDTGSGDAGGDSGGSGDAGDSGDSGGTGGAVGSAVGGLGNAVGGAGGGGGNADKDKSKDNGKDKDKSD